VILGHVAAATSNLAAVERVARPRLGLERIPAERARMQLFVAQLELAQGRYRDASRSIEAAVALPAPRRVEYHAMMATLPFLAVPAAELAALRDVIAAHRDLPLSAEGGPFADRGVEYPHLLWPGMYRPRRLYVLGALHVALGDIAGATAIADSLGADLGRDDPDEPLVAGYARLTRARATAARGHAAAALATLGPVQPPARRTFESFVDYGRPYERWLRAELLRETGRTAEALRWYGTFPDPAARDLAYLAPSHLRRAAIHENAGDARLAAYHYRRFVELWADADPELQPEVERARARLRALTRR
jgi:tetratricopeptide (TPR) repeat protein